MMTCPPFCGRPPLEMQTMLGSNELALALTALVLLVIAGFALYRRLRPANQQPHCP